MTARGYPRRSPFAHLVKPEERSADDTARLRDDARRHIWRRHGLAVIDPEDVDSEWLRQAIIAEANRRYGQRGRQA